MVEKKVDWLKSGREGSAGEALAGSSEGEIAKGMFDFPPLFPKCSLCIIVTTANILSNPSVQDQKKDMLLDSFQLAYQQIKEKALLG